MVNFKRFNNNGDLLRRFSECRCSQSTFPRTSSRPAYMPVSEKKFFALRISAVLSSSIAHTVASYTNPLHDLWCQKGPTKFSKPWIHAWIARRADEHTFLYLQSLHTHFVLRYLHACFRKFIAATHLKAFAKVAAVSSDIPPFAAFAIATY